MKNRKREICTSGSVRDEGGQHPHLLGRSWFGVLGYRGEVLLARADGCVSAGGRARRRPCTGGSVPDADLAAKNRGPFQTVPVMARAIADRLE